MPAALQDVGAPAFGEVTSQPLKQVATFRRVFSRMITLLWIGLLACVWLDLSFLYVIAASVVLCVADFAPYWFYRERPAFRQLFVWNPRPQTMQPQPVAAPMVAWGTGTPPPPRLQQASAAGGAMMGKTPPPPPPMPEQK